MTRHEEPQSEAFQDTANATDQHTAILIEISQDEMQAYLTLHATENEFPTLSDLLQVLETHKVVKGICMETLEDIIQQRESVMHVLVANGIPATRGKDAQFTPLIKKYRKQRPPFDFEDIKPYIDASHLDKIQPGTPLMEKIPATQGEAGFSVTAKPLPGLHGRDLPFDLSLHGCEINLQQENQIVARTLGYAVVCERGVRIDESLKIIDDLSSYRGELEHEGTVIIRGHLGDNFTVDVTGDLIVTGLIGPCQLTVGGNLIAQGGIIAPSAPYTNTEEFFATPRKTLIDCQGDVYAKSIDGVSITTPNKVHILDYACHCHVRAHDLHCGEKNGQGLLLSGVYEISGQLIAKTLGNYFNHFLNVNLVELKLEVDLFSYHSQLKKAEEIIQTMTQLKERILHPTTKLQQKPDAEVTTKIRQLESTIDFYQHLKIALQGHLNELEAIDHTLHNLIIEKKSVGQALINVLGHTLPLEQKLKKARVYADEKQVYIERLEEEAPAS